MKKIVILVIGLMLISIASAETAMIGLKTTADLEGMANNPAFYFSLGKFLAEKGYFNSAEKYLLMGLEIRDDAVARHNLGVVYYNRGESNAADEQFRKSVELDNNYGKAYYSLGLLLAGEGKLEEALVSLVKTTELELDNADAFFDAGIVLGRLNRFTEAKEYFRKAAEINPDFAEAKQNLEFLTNKGY